MSTQLDLITIGRVSVDLYGEQVGSRLEDVSTFAKGLGGCPANIAIGLARLGLKSGLISRVGDEPMGRFVLEQLRREGVSTQGVTVDPERLTSLVLLAIRSESSFPLVFYRDNCADSALSEADIDATYIASANAVLVTGTHFSRAASAAAQAKAMAIARSANRKIILDVDYRPNLWGIGGHGAGDSRYARSSRVTEALTPHLSLCDLIVGTEEELHIAGGAEDTLQACRNIRKLAKQAVIVCKRGAMGCVVIPGDIPNSLEGGIVGHGMPVEVFNVLGAGDAFLAGFLSGYLRNDSFENCVRYANACGAFAVSRLLCSSEYPTTRELNWYLQRGSPHEALRKDERLNHLHWATTRRRQPDQLMAFAIDHRSQLEEMANRLHATHDRIERLKELAVKAAVNVAQGRDGFGMLLDGTYGASALELASQENLWLARPVELPGSRPLEFDHMDSLATELTEWPTAVTVAGARAVATVSRLPSPKARAPARNHCQPARSHHRRHRGSRHVADVRDRDLSGLVEARAPVDGRGLASVCRCHCPRRQPVPRDRRPRPGCTSRATDRITPARCIRAPRARLRGRSYDIRASRRRLPVRADVRGAGRRRHE
jgi:5-dehydro-2-deoxygluconokinase